MFSEDWNLDLLNSRATQVIEDLEKEGIARYLTIPGEKIALPATSNIETADNLLVVSSGYPEHAGIWSYTLLDKSFQEPELFIKTSMEPIFRDLYTTDIGLIVLNPHAEELKELPDESLVIYLSQLQKIYEFIYQTRERELKFLLLGFSLGVEGLLRFLKKNLHYAKLTKELFLIDPVPPSTGRNMFSPEVLELIDNAPFYGMGNPEGDPDKLALFTGKILGITPEIFYCHYHGEMPNLVWPKIFQELTTRFSNTS